MTAERRHQHADAAGQRRRRRVHDGHRQRRHREFGQQPDKTAAGKGGVGEKGVTKRLRNSAKVRGKSGRAMGPNTLHDPRTQHIALAESTG